MNITTVGGDVSQNACDDVNLLKMEDKSIDESDNSPKLEKSKGDAVLSAANEISNQTKLKTTIKASKTTVTYKCYLTILLKDSSSNAIKSKTVKVVFNKKHIQQQ